MTGELFSGTISELELMERHIMLLKATEQYQPVGIIRLSEITGIPKHKVRYSLRLLERDNLIVATSDGAMVSDRYEQFMAEISERLEEIRAKAEEIRSKLRTQPWA